ncbi:MFS transporter [Hephaestia sp. GCM10023244]|uniref:MFS transporter n=1 Tax=unclassified Hephaestia TaxID=2631281 RepID=UPI002076DF45|nr:MFS transporter [Hephaestia sp. MAHUQ-44]MCM8732307.1 MFS transporter [Hephaestia sp. MAHUQ-44]
MPTGGWGVSIVGSEAASRLSPFSYPLFRSIWLANLVANLGYLIQSVGAAWLMTQLAPSPRMVALVQASATLPIMLLALVAGAIADTYDRRRVMLAAQGFMLTASFTLAMMAGLHWVTPALLLGFTFLVGCGMALNGPAWQASVGDLVPKTVLPAAVGYNSVAFNVARSLGPAIGGAIVAAAGAAAAFLANCVGYIGLIVVLLRWRPAPRGHTLPPERIGSAIGSGLRYVAMSPHLLRIMVRAAMFAAPSSAISALMPLVARDFMGGGAITFGVLLGAFGVGAIGGALISAPLRRRAQPQLVVSVAAVGVALGAAVLAMSRSLVPALPALAFAGGAWILAMSTLNASVQLGAPRWMVARVVATYQTAAFGGLAFGAWLFGMVADAYGLQNALLTAAGLQLLSVLAGQLLRLPHVDHLDLDPLDRWKEPSTAVPIEARSGPIAITLTYRVDPADVPEFLLAMAERRRIRRRDGARRWTLSCDLADSRAWIERYQVPTWLDYIRHNQRRTHADSANFEHIQRLHRGAGPPEVRRVIEVDPANRPSPAAVIDPLSDHP